MIIRIMNHGNFFNANIQRTEAAAIVYYGG